jgi:hypothetical protein
MANREELRKYGNPMRSVVARLAMAYGIDALEQKCARKGG